MGIRDGQPKAFVGSANARFVLICMATHRHSHVYRIKATQDEHGKLASSQLDYIDFGMKTDEAKSELDAMERELAELEAQG